jgi:apolipoprotein N-acyltransferase
MFEDDRVGAERIRAVVRESGIELLFGSDQMAHTTPPAYYNAAFMMLKDGSVSGVYRKMHLVPFGEFVPLKKLLFFVAPLVERAGEFTAGQSTVMLRGSHGTISTAICYEIIPGLVRQSVLGKPAADDDHQRRGYGQSSAPYRHFLRARACHRGRPVPPDRRTPASAASSIRTDACSSDLIFSGPSSWRRPDADADGLQN